MDDLDRRHATFSPTYFCLSGGDTLLFLFFFSSLVKFVLHHL